MCEFCFRGEMEELAIGMPLVFGGIEISLFKDRHIALRQLEFYRQIPELHLHQFSQDIKMVLSERETHSKATEVICGMLFMVAKRSD